MMNLGANKPNQILIIPAITQSFNDTHMMTQTPSSHLVLPSALLTDVQGDPMSLFFGADQVDIVGDQELASTSYRGTPRWYKEGGAKVRGPLLQFQLQEKK